MAKGSESESWVCQCHIGSYMPVLAASGTWPRPESASGLPVGLPASSFVPTKHRRLALCLSPKLQASTTRRFTKCPGGNDATEDEVLHDATRIRSPSRPGSVSPRAASLLSSASARRLPRGRKGFLLGFPEASKGGRCCPVSASNGPVDVAATHSRGLRASRHCGSRTGSRAAR